MEFNKLSDIDTPEFWVQVMQDISNLDNNWASLCASSTFKSVWESSNERTELRRLGQEFLDQKYSPHHYKFYIYGGNILLFAHRNYDNGYCYEESRELGRDFNRWNMKRIINKSTTTIAQ